MGDCEHFWKTRESLNHPCPYCLQKEGATQAAKAQRDNSELTGLLKECKKVMKANSLFRNTITAHDLCKRISVALSRSKL